LIAPAIMPIEAKLANDTRNTERMPSPRGVMLAAIFCSSIIATNSLATSLVAMMLPAFSASLSGMPISHASG